MAFLEDRVVVPEKLKHGMLKLLHSNHSGLVKMKQLARRTIYWLGLNADIEDFVKSCESCVKMAVVPKTKSVESWIPTKRPFSRIHADFFYFDKKTFLLIVDSHSKSLEVEIMPYGTNAKSVIKKFISLFARFGLPDVVVTDGGPPFNSKEFISFLEHQGIKVLKSPPYNPASNGQAERMVRVAKDVLKKFLLDEKTRSLDIEDRLNLFLINYRNSCLGAEGRYPSENVFSFKPKMLLDLINPRNNYKNNLVKSSERTVDIDIETPTPPDDFDKLVAGDKLYYKNYDKRNLPRWLEAKFIKKLSKYIFQITLSGHKLSAHRHQLKMVHRPTRRTKVIVNMNNTTSTKRRRSVSVEDDFFGFQDAREENEDPPMKKKYLQIRSPILTRSKTSAIQDAVEG